MREKKNNFNLDGRPRLNELVEANMFQKKTLDKDEEEYFLLATPSKKDLTITLTVQGKEEEIYIPKFLAAEFNKQKDVLKPTETGYKFWVYCKNEVLEELGFFKTSNFKVKKISLTEFEAKKIKKVEKVYPFFSDKFKKYEMLHYYMSFSRFKTLKNSHEDLKNILKCLKPYYDYFSEGQPGHDLLKFYPQNVIGSSYKFPKIMKNGGSYVVRILPPHVSIAIGVQLLPYLDAMQEAEVREALQFALASARAYPETFASLSEVTTSTPYLTLKQDYKDECQRLFRLKHQNKQN